MSCAAVGHTLTVSPIPFCVRTRPRVGVCVCGGSGCAKSLQPCLTLCDSVDCSPPGFSVLGILQARILEREAVPSFTGYSPLRDRTLVLYGSCTAGGFFATKLSWKPLHLVPHPVGRDGGWGCFRGIWSAGRGRSSREAGAAALRMLQIAVPGGCSVSAHTWPPPS